MYEDVAGMLTHLCTIRGKVSFGSPLTPVRCTLVHRTMFDQISEICANRWLRHSVWVDDLSISGNFVPGQVVDDIREVVRISGLRSHKVCYRAGNRPVMITGIGVIGRHLLAPNSLNLQIKQNWQELHEAQTADDKADCTLRLLTQPGTVRHIVGTRTDVGQRTANQMNALRQKREKWLREASEERWRMPSPSNAHDPADIPF